MPRGHPWTHCLVCHKPISEVGKLSARGRCEGCGRARNNENHEQLLAHSGPFFDHWRKRTLAAFGVFEADASAAD